MVIGPRGSGRGDRLSTSIDRNRCRPTCGREAHRTTRARAARAAQEFFRGGSFPFPKSLYAVEDALRSSSETSRTRCPRLLRRLRHDCPRRHATQQAGRRATAVDLVTNNEVSAEEAAALRERRVFVLVIPDGRRSGSASTSPSRGSRRRSPGKTPEGEPIEGDYKFTDEFPMADGFEENVEFFDLTYEDPSEFVTVWLRGDRTLCSGFGPAAKGDDASSGG